MYAIASSGGKDSTLALYHAQQSGFAVAHLFHVYNTDTTRVRFHGYKSKMVEEQARLMGLKSIIMPIRSQEFDNDFRISLNTVRQVGLKGIIFGNMFLRDVREFYETRVRSVGLKYHDILWRQLTKSVLEDFVQSDFTAIITSVWLKKLDRKYIGRQIQVSFLADLEKEGVDICGENGEYHSLAYDGPCFKEPLQYRIGETHEEMGNIFLDVGIA